MFAFEYYSYDKQVLRPHPVNHYGQLTSSRAKVHVRRQYWNQTVLNRVGAVVYVLSYLIKTAFVADQSFTDPFKKNKTQIFAIKGSLA